jgi:V/A-type H+-transporting ATPase subunit A
VSSERGRAGRITGVFGPVVRAEIDFPVALSEVARVGEKKLLGEVIELDGHEAVAQVYEDTAGLAPGDPFWTEGAPLSVELGPGLLGQVYDGIQRPLEWLAREEGDFLGRGRTAPALDRDRLWTFVPSREAGEGISPGAVLGTVRETGAIEHRVLVPPEIRGRIVEIAASGPHRVADVIALIETAHGMAPIRLFQRWKVRAPRPVAERRTASEPLVTGQRVLDTFFPLPRGGAAGMPGGFGTGKTVTQQQLCKWAWADVIVYVGCGERGNEMTHVLADLPRLVDPRTGRPLSERTVLVANTSNMPVAAREASLYTAVTIAEYYRDMGYHVAVLADSTSRWAEALREISGRLEEIPAEEGYPASLSSRLATFYERAGRATALSGAEGSVTLISAISPPGGDLTEPVTRHTRRFTRCFWTLEKERAEARIFPAVSIEDSDADVSPEMATWWAREADPDWDRLRREALAFLQEAGVIERTARLIGSEGLPEKERFLLETARLFEDGFLRQNAYDPKDAFCSPRRQARLLRAHACWRERGLAAVARGVSALRLFELPVARELAAAPSVFGEDEIGKFDGLFEAIDRAIGELEAASAAPPVQAAPGAA